MNKFVKRCTLFIFFSTFLSFLTSFSVADTLTANRTIRDGQTITSAGGEFELGFSGPGRSTNRYFGIWYKKKASGKIVWVANRETPLTTKGDVLKFSSKGVLILLSGTDSIIWSSISFKNPVAQLLKTGNLVIRNVDDLDLGKFFWQSFDYPDNTFLPGMKLPGIFDCQHYQLCI